MKFSVERDRLLKPLQQVIAPLGNRAMMPVLANFLIQVSEGVLSVTGTDLEIEIIARFTLSLPYDAGETTVPARKFVDICRCLPKGAKIKIQLEGSRILIRSSRSRFLLSTLPASDFPKLEKCQRQVEFTLSQTKMKRLIEATQFSMANQDVRYYLNGMLFEINGRELCAVATDGHRLAACSILTDIALSNLSVIVPRKGIIGLMRMLDHDGDIPLHVQISNNNIRVHISNFTFTSKLIDGRFPDYRHALPKFSKKKLEVNRNALKQAFSRVSILSNEKLHSVRLCFSENQLKILSNNAEQEEAEEILDVIYSGDEMEIGFNVKYILDVLNTLKCENVRILLIDSMSSAKFEDTTSQNVTYIVMPIRL